ncbi:MAG: FAD-binding oxidoreductase [Acidimicrobiales bacterium]|nr:FAD-binding oxidoreductase [Acidimicrobiales bacterium]
MTRTSLTGWGRTNPSVAEVVDLFPSELPATLKEAGDRGVLARGLGRSYGDAAQNSGGLVVRLMGSATDAVLDRDRGEVTVSAGADLDELLRHLVPRGFFVPVTPGTRHVTIGGAIASDIHGKNHHVDGSFGNHVVRMTMQLADGSVVQVSPADDPDLFWATIGGMGLTGIVLEATVRLLRVETSRMSVDTHRVRDLDSLMAMMDDGDDDAHRYSVAWIDLAAKGRQMGRSVLTRGDHARFDQLPAAMQTDPLAYGPSQLVSVPPVIPRPGLLNHLTVAAFNELWFRKAPKRKLGGIDSIAMFFHPLDMVGEWTRFYGRSGLVQYQLMVPFGEEDAMRRIVERVSSSGVASFLAVLKRFGAGNDAPLSFPQPGWTLALDMPAGAPGLDQLLHRLDDMVLEVGGRNYFAKDAHTAPETIRRGYPRLADWQAVRDRVDPHGVWQSDLGRRLRLAAHD